MSNTLPLNIWVKDDYIYYGNGEKYYYADPSKDISEISLDIQTILEQEFTSCVQHKNQPPMSWKSIKRKAQKKAMLYKFLFSIHREHGVSYKKLFTVLKILQVVIDLKIIEKTDVTVQDGEIKAIKGVSPSSNLRIHIQNNTKIKPPRHYPVSTSSAVDTANLNG